MVFTFIGRFWAFACGALFGITSALPLLGSESLPIQHETVLVAHPQFFAGGLAFSDGLMAASVSFTWQIVLFQTLGESFENFGGSMSDGLMAAVSWTVLEAAVLQPCWCGGV